MCRDARAISGACPAGGNHARLLAEHALHSREDAVHQVREAVKEPGLHGLRRVRGNDLAGIANFDAPEARGARKQRVRRDSDSGCERSAEIFALG